MKTTILLFALIFSSISFAEVINEDNYNTDIKVKPTAIKCSLFGKVKMKVKGLQGKIGKGWLKAQRFEGKCSQNVADVKAQLNSRNNTVAAEVNVVTELLKREVIQHHDRDFPRFGHYEYVTPKYYSYTECHTEEVTKLRATLPRVLVNNEQVVLKRTHVKLVSVTYGRCR